VREKVVTETEKQAHFSRKNFGLMYRHTDMGLDSDILEKEEGGRITKVTYMDELQLLTYWLIIETTI
jgi:hypothetical protein